MIICSLPRCGATKYCLDLQDQTGLEFVGELNPIYISEYGDTAKRDNHETGYQPLYSIEKYNSIISSPHKYIILVNQSPHLMVDRSEVVMLRRNMKDAFISQANFFVKCRPYLKGEGILQHLYMSFQSFYGVVSFLSQNSWPIVWYEDYFNLSGTKSDALDSHPHKKIIYTHIDNMFNIGKVQQLLDGLK